MTSIAIAFTEDELKRILKWYAVSDMESQTDTGDKELAERLEKILADPRK